MAGSEKKTAAGYFSASPFGALTSGGFFQNAPLGRNIRTGVRDWWERVHTGYEAKTFPLPSLFSPSVLFAEEEVRRRLAAAKGRTSTVLTGGLTNTGLTLGKPTLLGM